MSSHQDDHERHDHERHDHDHSDEDPATYWENRYRERGQSWSGRPNAALVAEAGGLVPGRALDLGCGEGGDAIWLAQQGWTVTAVDISPAAMELGARDAATAGVADQIDWVAADLAVWRAEGLHELVASQFLHSPVELPREQILRRAAAGVAPGGVLLVVGHGEFPPWSSHSGDEMSFPDPAEVLASLDLPVAQWQVLRSAMVAREATGPDGTVAILSDSVLTVRRSAG